MRDQAHHKGLAKNASHTHTSQGTNGSETNMTIGTNLSETNMTIGTNGSETKKANHFWGRNWAVPLIQVCLRLSNQIF